MEFKRHELNENDYKGAKLDIQLNDGDVPYLYFENINKTKIAKNAFSTRMGGVSKEHLSTMNLAFERGDERENVLENYKRMAKATGIDFENMVLSKQTHTTNILRVGKEHAQMGITKERNYDNIDGLVTNEKGITLVTLYADCVPLFFVDPVNNAIGAGHSGWKGTANRMGKCMVQKMQQEFGSNPNDIVAGIGPSICQDCYEVSEDVIEKFRNEFSQEIISDICYKKANGKYQLNLWKANYHILLEAGIRAENISITDICTCCNSEMLFSHRASHGLRGNMGAFLTLI